MKTFDVTKTNNPIFFTIDQDIFEAIPADRFSANILASYFHDINDGNLFIAHDSFFEAVLTEDSYKRFSDRLISKKDPITVSVLGDIATWLTGDEYLGGKSWGRAQALIGFAVDAWEEFDGWCLMHGINDPWKLPSYRFGALVLTYLKDDKLPEGIAEIENSLANTDSVLHPFLDKSFQQTVKTIGGILSTSSSTGSTTIDNVIYDPRLADLPVEERKRLEATAAGKPFRVPEWWRGERTNYKVASSMMKTLPKKIGPVK